MLSSSHSQGRVNSQLQLSSCTANSAGERGVGESIACCRPEEASCGPNAESATHLLTNPAERAAELLTYR